MTEIWKSNTVNSSSAPKITAILSARKKNVVTSKDMAAISTYYLEIQSLHPFKIFPLHLRSDLDCTPLGPPPPPPLYNKGQLWKAYCSQKSFNLDEWSGMVFSIWQCVSHLYICSHPFLLSLLCLTAYLYSTVLFLVLIKILYPIHTAYKTCFGLNLRHFKIRRNVA